MTETLFPLLSELVIIATLLPLAAMGICRVFCKKSAAFRCQIWILTLLGLLVFPVASRFLPRVFSEKRADVTDSVTTASSQTPVHSLQETTPLIEKTAVVTEEAAVTTPILMQHQTADSTPHHETIAETPPNAKTAMPSKEGIAFDWKTPLVIVWLCGMFLGAWSLGMSMLAARKLVRFRTASFNDPRWLQCCASTARLLQIRKTPRLLVCETITVPMIAGIVRPLILIPNDEHLDPQSVLVHELSHIKRRDPLWLLVSRIVCVAYWFHPLAWFTARKIQIERELACDDTVLESGKEAGFYATLLLDLAAKLPEGNRYVGLTVSMARKHQVEERIDAILDATKKRSPLSRRAAWGLLLLLLFAVCTAAIFSPFAPLRFGNRFVAAAIESEIEPEISRDSKIDGLKIQVVDESGQPQPGIECKMIYANNETQLSSLPVMKKTTDVHGEVLFSVNTDEITAFSIQAKSTDQSRQAAYPLTLGKPFRDKADGGLGLGNVLKLTLQPAKKIEGTVVDADGRGIAEAMVGVQCFVPGGDERTDRIAAYFPVISNQTTTDANGTYTLLIPQNAQLVTVFAKKDGKGLDFVSSPAKASHQFFGNVAFAQDMKGPTLKLDRVHPLKIKLTDEQGKGIPGLRVWPTQFINPAFQDGSGTLVALRLSPDFSEMTDENGIAHFKWFNFWENAPVTFMLLDGNSLARPPYAHDTIEFIPRENKDEITVVLRPYTSIRGKVKQADGTAAADVVIQVFGGEYPDGPLRTVKTDVSGRYEMLVPSDFPVSIKAEDRNWASLPTCNLVAGKDAPLENVDLTVQKTTRLHGRILTGPENKPVQTQVCLTQFSDPQLATPEFYPKQGYVSNNDYENPMKGEGKITCYVIDPSKDGLYELYLGPGHYRFCSGYSRGKVFTISDETEIAMDFNPMPGEVASQEELRRFFDRTLGGHVTLDRRSVPKAAVSVVSPAEDRVWATTADDTGCYEIEVAEGDRLVFARDQTGKFAALVKSPKGNNVARVELLPTKTVHGRLIDETTDQPVVNCKFQCSPRFPGLNSHQGSFEINITTDHEGRFTIPHLAVECPYEMSKSAVFSEDPDAWGSVYTLGKINLSKDEQAEDIDLGDFKIETLEADEITRMMWYLFNSTEQGTVRRFETVKNMAKDNHRRIFVLFDKDTTGERNTVMPLIRMAFYDPEGKKAFERYQLFCVNLMKGRTNRELPELAEQLGIEQDKMTDGTFCILDADGKILTMESVRLYFKESEEINKIMFLELLKKFAP